ncbi:MAG: crossover junction endodeoxyribonuclease RuvC [Candidatus Midichloriaceae bacterium]|jgi:crossover junction endodeoxyribonuclease RuvC
MIISKRFIGVDPGLNFTGWGILDQQGSDNFVYVASGVIKTSKKSNYPERLSEIFKSIHDIVLQYNPNFAAIEDTYVNVNNQSSIKLAQAKAASMIAISNNKIDLVEYPAKTIKKTVTGNGNADKRHIVKMLKLLIPGVDIELFDEADAVAIALCHAIINNKN